MTVPIALIRSAEASVGAVIWGPAPIASDGRSPREFFWQMKPAFGTLGAGPLTVIATQYKTV